MRDSRARARACCEPGAVCELRPLPPDLPPYSLHARLDWLVWWACIEMGPLPPQSNPQPCAEESVKWRLFLL